MKNYILIIGLFVFTACSEAQIAKKEIQGELYANEYGEIILTRVNDSLMRTIFKNNKGDVFDTIMLIKYDSKLFVTGDSLPFLQLKMGGLSLYNECLYVRELSSMAYLQCFIEIEKMYIRPFYKIGEKVTIKGEARFHKGGTTINGIYLKGFKKSKERNIVVHGIINKEKYPIGYYSTKESPQGMFSDTSIVHYRLIIDDYTFEKLD